MVPALPGAAGHLAISDTKVEPNPAVRGEEVLISCTVTHSAGPMNIERVAATAFESGRTTAYTRLYDDGTHGDKSARDGVYSLQIKASDATGIERIVFQAVELDKHEIESEAIILTVK